MSEQRLRMSKQRLGPIEDGSVRLRALEAADLPLTLSWRNLEAVRRCFFHSEIITAEQHVRWFEQYLQRDDDFVFIIEQLAVGGRPVGQAALYHVDRLAERAEFGRLMIGVPEAAGKGLAYAALRLLLRLAFEELGLNEVYLEVLPQNERAIGLYRRAGFETLAADEKALVMKITAARFAQAQSTHGI